LDRRSALHRVAAGILGAVSLTIGRAQDAVAQPPVKVHRVGLLDASVPNTQLWRPLMDRLRELGYVEGKTIVFERRWAYDKVEDLSRLATELVQLRCDVLVTAGTPPAVAAKRATNTIPIVMASSADPIAVGLIETLAKPGGNVTGMTSLAAHLNGKRLQLLKQLLPKLNRVAVLWYPPNIIQGPEIADITETAEALGVHVQLVATSRADALGNAFSEMRAQRAQALLVVPSALFLTERDQLARLAAQYQLPAIYARREYVQAGGLISYAVSFPEMFKRAAEYVDRILKGASPTTLPVEAPKKLELVINQRSAQALGLAVPKELLLRADEVIE
jgi:putative ABC transport system substrate-binding protein